MSEVVSLQTPLTEKYTAIIAEAEAAIADANENLGRVALIYGGQLSFSVLRDDIGFEDVVA